MLGPIRFPLEGLAPSHLYSLIVHGDIGSVENHFTQYAILAGVIQCNNLIADLSVLGDIRRLVTAGELVGNVYARSLLALSDTGGTGTPGIFIGSGDINSMIWIYDGFDRTIELPADIGSTGLLRLPSMPAGSSVLVSGNIQDDGGLLLVDGEMAGTITVLGTNGLEGQIIINGVNTSDPNHELWSGNIEIGSMTLGPTQSGDYDAPYYSVLSGTIGGGAIGLMPFMYHAFESSPKHGTVITTGGFTGNVTIEHYGPVADGDGNTSSTPPVKVYELALRVPCCDPAPNPATTGICDEDENEDLYWTDVTSSYTYSVSGRVVTVSGTFSNWKAYQFIPVDLVYPYAEDPVITYAQGWEGSVGCGGTESYGHGFQLKSGMGLFDLNEDDAIDEGDIEAWLVSPVDFDGNHVATLNDLLILVDAVANEVE